MKYIKKCRNCEGEFITRRYFQNICNHCIKIKNREVKEELHKKIEKAKAEARYGNYNPI